MPLAGVEDRFNFMQSRSDAPGKLPIEEQAKPERRLNPAGPVEFAAPVARGQAIIFRQRPHR